MISRTKKDLTNREIETLCASAGFTGVSNIHALGAGEFNAVYAFDADGREYAMKVAPTVDTPVMTYEQDMMRAELFWYGQIAKHTDVPVPEIVYADLSRTLLPSDFFIMQRIDGTQMNEMQFSPQEMAQVSMLMPQFAAKLHHVAGNGFGYLQNGLHSTWASALYTMTEALVQDAARMGQTCENGEKALQYIRKHTAVLENVPCCLVNYDLWEANILCKRTDAGLEFVLIDPERSFWGDPVMDFNCFGFGSSLHDKQETMQVYNKIAPQPIEANRGVAIRNAFAQAYLGVIMEVERYYRYVPGDEGWTRNNKACAELFQSAFACLAME